MKTRIYYTYSVRKGDEFAWEEFTTFIKSDPRFSDIVAKNKNDGLIGAVLTKLWKNYTDRRRKELNGQSNQASHPA